MALKSYHQQIKMVWVANGWPHVSQILANVG
jgi:hypothetical protein